MACELPLGSFIQIPGFDLYYFSFTATGWKASDEHGHIQLIVSPTQIVYIFDDATETRLFSLYSDGVWRDEFLQDVHIPVVSINPPKLVLYYPTG